MVTIRHPIVSGIFYDNSKKALMEKLHILQEKTVPPTIRDAAAIITPHAALEYIGETATTAYLSVGSDSIKRILLLGPVHRERENKVYLPRADYFSTPLDDTPVDTESITQLIARGDPFVLDDTPHLEEHCLEVQLPFISYYFPGIPILPLLVGALTMKSAKIVTEALCDVIPDVQSRLLTIATINGIERSTETRRMPDDNLRTFLNPEQYAALFSRNSLDRFHFCSPHCLGIILHQKFCINEIHLLHHCHSPYIEQGGGKTVRYSAYALRKGEGQ